MHTLTIFHKKTYWFLLALKLLFFLGFSWFLLPLLLPGHPKYGNSLNFHIL